MKFFRWRQRKDEELNTEIQNHLDEAIRDRMARGESAEQARVNARREFGNVSLVREVTREMWGWSALERLLQDLRFGVRLLFKQKGFTLIAILTLALGIGANTAIFSVVNAVLLRPLPFSEPERLMTLWASDVRQGDQSSISYPNFADWRVQSQSFERLAVYRTRNFALTGEDEPVRMVGAVGSAELFTLLGVAPGVGRNFRAEEDQPGANVVILSNGLWQRRFNSDPQVVGRTITLNGRNVTIVGVMPAGFQFPIGTESVELWTTIAWDAANPDGSTPMTAQRGLGYLKAIGRLKPQVTVAQAQAEMDTIARRLEQQYPDKNAHQGVRLVPALEQLVRETRRPLLVLFGAVGCVLLIACANIANLLLARATVRRREMAVRAALGASRGRVIRQLLTESLLLALAGGVCGWLLALWGTHWLIALGPEDIPRLQDVRLSGSVFGFTLLVSLLTGALFGLAPAVQVSKTALTEALKEGGRGGDGARHRLCGALVIAQTAIALVLMVGASLLLGSFWRLSQVDPGFAPQNVFTLRLSLPDSKYAGTQAVTFYEQLQARLQILPGVRAASASWFLPLSGTNPSLNMDIEGRPAAPGERFEIDSHFVLPDFFRAMGIQLRAGRDFSVRDDARGQPVVIVNEAFQRRFFPTENPLGKRIRPAVSSGKGEAQMREIIGIVSNVKHRGLASEPQPMIYLSYVQVPVSNSMTFVVRTAADPLSLLNAARAEVQRLDKELPLFEVKTLDQYFSAAVAPARFNALLLAIFADVALLLTAVGLYGVMSYSVTQRTPEIGIRLALGAPPRKVLRLVLTQGLKLALAGISLGLLAAFALTHWLKSLLFGVRPTDPLTFAGVALLLSLVALLACWIPARRATKVDPLIALRHE